MRERLWRNGTVRWWALLLPAFLYLGAANGFLNSSSLLDGVNGWRDGHLEYRYALSWFPGRVRVYGARLRHQDRNVQWTAHFDRVDLALSIGALLRSQFHVRVAKARGVRLRLRFRKAEDLARRVKEGVFPPFSPLPEKPPPASPSRSWAVRMDRVEIADFREIWLGEFRYRGPATLEGGFRLQGGRWAEVGPASLAFLGGTVTLGRESVAEAFRGTVRADIGRFSADVTTAAFLRHVNADARLDAARLDLRFLNFYLAPAGWLRLDGGGGPGRVRLRLSGGRLVAPSRITADAADTRLRVRRFRLKGNASADFRVFRDSRGEAASLTLRLEGIRGRHPVTAEAVSEIRRGEVKAVSRRLALAEGFPDLALSARLVGGRLRLPAFATDSLRLDRGLVLFSADWRGSPGKAEDRGSLSARIRKVKGSVLGVPLRSEGELGLAFGESSMRRGRFRLEKGHLTLGGDSDGAAYGLSVTVEPGARLRLDPSRAQGRAYLAVASPDGFLGRVAAAAGTPALVTGLIDWDHLSARVALRETGRSAWLLWLGPLAVGLETKEDGRRWILHRADRWFAEDGAILTGDGRPQAQAGPLRGRLVRGSGLRVLRP